MLDLLFIQIGHLTALSYIIRQDLAISSRPLPSIHQRGQVVGYNMPQPKFRFLIREALSQKTGYVNGEIDDPEDGTDPTSPTDGTEDSIAIGMLAQSKPLYQKSKLNFLLKCTEGNLAN